MPGMGKSTLSQYFLNTTSFMQPFILAKSGIKESIKLDFLSIDYDEMLTNLARLHCQNNPGTTFD